MVLRFYSNFAVFVTALKSGHKSTNIDCDVSRPPVVLISLEVCRVLIFLSAFAKDHPMKGWIGDQHVLFSRSLTILMIISRDLKKLKVPQS